MKIFILSALFLNSFAMTVAPQEDQKICWEKMMAGCGNRNCRCKNCGCGVRCGC